MKLPILYARSSTGKVLEWEIEIEGAAYRTITGQQGGAKVTSAWTTCQGKSAGKSNATTPEAQARKDAEAQWRKKCKSGGYWEDMGDIDQQKFIEPMLANKFEDHKHKIVYPVMVDRKYNGMRIVSTKDGPRTRKGEVVHTVPHLTEGLRKFFDRYPNAMIDGEAYNHNLRFQLNDLISVVRKTRNFTEEDLAKSRDIVGYYIYDGYGFEGITVDTPCMERREALKKVFAKAPPMFQVVDYQIAHDEAAVYAIYQEYVADGYEGAIIRTNTAYEHKRTNALLKCKPIDDMEVIIQDVKEGEGNWAGLAKIITVKTKEGLVFDATFKGSMALAQQVLDNKQDWIGKTVTIYYNGLTGKGTPNYAQFDPRNSCKGDR